MEVLVCAAELTNMNFIESDYDQIKQEVFSEVSKVHGCMPNVVILLEPRTIPKTTSGKIARQWTKKAYIQGTLQILSITSNLDDFGTIPGKNKGKSGGGSNPGSLAGSQHGSYRSSPIPRIDVQQLLQPGVKVDPTSIPVTTTLEILHKVVADCLEIEKQSIKTNQPLSMIGVDSMRGWQLVNGLEAKFTVSVPDAVLEDRDTTLVTIATSLHNNGAVSPRPILLDTWRMLDDDTFVMAMKGEYNGSIPEKMYRAFGLISNIDEKTFPKGRSPPHPHTGSFLCILFPHL